VNNSNFPFGDQGLGALGEQFNDFEGSIGDAKRSMMIHAARRSFLVDVERPAV
jgi:hypothetical protein